MRRAPSASPTRARRAAWRDWAHSFAWLRDLAAAADRTRGADVAQPVVARWLADHAEFDAAAWTPELVARRLIFWTTYAPYILSSPDLVYRSTVLNTLARMARHLDRAVDKLPEGMPRIAAAAGLNVAALLIPGVDARLLRAEGLLDRALAAIVAADGGVADRAPATQLVLIELLLHVRAAYTARGRRPAEPLIAALERLVPALAAVALGDGGVGGWHGPGIASARLAAVFAASGVIARPSRAAGTGGYQRVAGGTTLLVVDAAPPPQARAATAAHAGTLGFELCERCEPRRRHLRRGGRRCRCRRRSPRGCGRRRRIRRWSSPTAIRPASAPTARSAAASRRSSSARHESEDGVWLDLAHDGYARRFGVRHRRRLFVVGERNRPARRGQPRTRRRCAAAPARRGGRASTSVSTSAPGSRRRRPPTARGRSSSCRRHRLAGSRARRPAGGRRQRVGRPRRVTGRDQAARRQRDDERRPARAASAGRSSGRGSRAMIADERRTRAAATAQADGAFARRRYAGHGAARIAG